MNTEDGSTGAERARDAEEPQEEGEQGVAR